MHLERNDSTRASALIEALPSYYPALDGLRAFSVFFVIFEHVTLNKTALSHFHGWLGVDIFFVLSGFLITGLLFREERIAGHVDMMGFYIRRAFRILPLYWLVLVAYVVSLQPAAQALKWFQMKAALPYFLTFNNDIPLILMPQKNGTIFGLSWTLGIEEKFYFFWPLICFILLKTFRRRVFAGWAVYGMTLLLALFSLKMARAYSGLIVGALLSMLFSSTAIVSLKRITEIIRPSLILLLLILGFALVDYNANNVFIFSWIITLLVASALLNPSWLSRFLELPLFVWLGKRSYAMYLIQGFGIGFVELFIKPTGAVAEIAIALLSLTITSLGASVLHRLVEEPARKFGKKLVIYRNEKKTFLPNVQVPVAD
jgi:peptidoglycan/LPS O-acetylase OafA/YrhL